MSRLSVVRYDDFTGGLNLRADQFQLARNESPDMLNVEIDPRGGVFSRGGMQSINTTPVSGTWAPERLYAFYGDAPRVMLTNNNNVLWSSGGDFTVLEYSAGNPIVSVGNHGACMAGWGDALYIATGAASGKVAYRWRTGDAYATAMSASGPTWQSYNNPNGTHLPRAEHLMVHANKMFAANTYENGVAYPNRVRWSHEGLPENWMQDDYFDFNGGGGSITGMSVVAGQLVVFKPNAIYLVIGNNSDNFQVVELSTRLGCSNHKSIAQAEDGVYFYSNPEGLFFYDGTKILDVFEPLRPLVDEGLLSTAADEPYAVSWVGRRLWMSMPFDRDGIATKPTVSFVYDPSIGSGGAYTKFATYDGYGLIGGTDFTDSNEDNFRLFVHPVQPHVLKVDLYKQEQDNVDGTPVQFASYYRTGWVDANGYASKKMFRRPDIVFKQVDTQRIVSVKVFQNYEEASGTERKQFDVTLTSAGVGAYWGTDLWGQGLWGTGSEGVTVRSGRNLGLARSVQLLFSGPALGSWGIDSITYKYNNRKVTG